MKAFDDHFPVKELSLNSHVLRKARQGCLLQAPKAITVKQVLYLFASFSARLELDSSVLSNDTKMSFIFPHYHLTRFLKAMQK